MRTLVAYLLAGLSGAILVGETQAQVRSTFKPVPGLYGRPAYVSPYLGTPFYNSNTLVTPYGAANLTRFGTTARPVYSGPFHTIYFDSLSNTYRYTNGYNRLPNVTTSLTVSPFINPYPTYPTYPYVNPYLSNPYLSGNPYLVNPVNPYVFP
jgi:hypothetical protein